MDDTYYMNKALRLAKKGSGFVSPNPMVGAVLVKDDCILSTGYHKNFGGSHAEVNVLLNLTKYQTEGSTLYVNLEPCSHYGKTPPCVDTIIKTGIIRVVVGTMDPNPNVNGRGIEKLKKNGIKVTLGILEEACYRLNESYFKYITYKKPFVTLKIAQTLDGKIATQTGHSRWITNDKSRQIVHKMRSESDSVMVGIDTVLSDDPELTVRTVRGRNPKRILLDSRLRIPMNASVLQHHDPENTILVISKKIKSVKIETLQKKGIQLWSLDLNEEKNIDLSKLLEKCADHGIGSVLVEGGKRLFTSFLESHEVDRIVIFIAPKVFGKGMEVFGNLGITSPEDAIQFKDTAWYKVGSDMMFEGRIRRVYRNH
jgi:diaminohydroxyphosphoribosylaminopyrimidine deaminase/5-amino-6-(5-phosphoribosylamino)uracil reductase